MSDMDMEMGMQMSGAGSTANASSGGSTPDLPAGATVIMDASALAVGSFPSTANAGSLGGDISDSGSAITVESGGPNSLNYAQSDNLNTYLRVASSPASDYITAAQGMIGLLFRFPTVTDDSDGVPWAVPNAFGNASQYFGLAAGSDGATHIRAWIFDTGRKEIKLAYTANTWRAVVMRWNGTTFYAKINGGDWEPIDAGNIGAVGDIMGMMNFGTATTGKIDAVKMAFYKTESESAGDDLIGHMAGIGGL